MSERWVERGPIPGPLHETASQSSCSGKGCWPQLRSLSSPSTTPRRGSRRLGSLRLHFHLHRVGPDHAADGASGYPRRILPLGRRDRGSRVHPHEDGGAGRGVDAHAGCNMRSPAASAMACLSPIFGLPSIVAAIGTMSLFRGTASILGEQAYNRDPASLAYFGQGDVISVNAFRVGSVCYRGRRLWLHAALSELRSADFRNLCRYGRCTLLGGRRRTDKIQLFCLTGLMSGVAAVLVTSGLSSTRPYIAQGYELDVIIMVVLPGVNIQGRAGSIPGCRARGLHHGFGDLDLGLLNIPGPVMSIIVGAMLNVVIGALFWRRLLLARSG
jgi:hypothetical protein